MNIQLLKDAGINYESGLHRFANNQRIYEKYLVRLASLTLMTDTRTALEANDYDAAFEAFHKLKAFVGNLSIPALYTPIQTMTEEFRTKSIGINPALEKLDHVEYLFQQVCHAIQEAQK